MRRQKAVAILAILAAVEYGGIPAPRTGFYCYDPKISFKFNGDTVTLGILLSGSFLLPLLGLWAVESSMDYADLAQQDLDIHGQLKGTGASRAGRSAWRGLRVAARWYREFLLGLGVVMVLTDAAKLLVAEPRPHFLDTCKPDAAINCSSPTQWIDDFVCTNQRLSWWNVRDSMRSFPSGHTSISVFTSLFMMFFLRRRLAPDVTFLLVPWLQGLFALWAAVCSFSRITDHRHHWWDVLAGSIVGVISAIYTVKMFCGNFSPSREPGEFGSDSGSIPKDQNQPLLNGTINRSAPERSTGLVDTVPARRLLSSSSSCASSLTTEERELREVSSP